MATLLKHVGLIKVKIYTTLLRSLEAYTKSQVTPWKAIAEPIKRLNSTCPLSKELKITLNIAKYYPLCSQAEAQFFQVHLGRIMETFIGWRTALPLLLLPQMLQ